MEIRLIPTGSKEYRQMVDLRIRALLEPIGIPGTYIVPEKEKNDFMIGAFENGSILGCCVLTPVDDSCIQLRQMAVHPNYQGMKIGAAIVRYAEDLAREKGYRKLKLHARNPVMDFYSKCGYTVKGEEFFEVGMGHHEMEKSLQE